MNNLYNQDISAINPSIYPEAASTPTTVTNNNIIESNQNSGPNSNGALGFDHAAGDCSNLSIEYNVDNSGGEDKMEFINNALLRDCEAEADDDKYFNSLPTGYRFKPTDEELIVHYLENKENNRELPRNHINEVELYQYEPEDLTARFKPCENQWYFFTPRDRKYPQGHRPNRAAGNGYWKASGADKEIYCDRNKVGLKKSLVFYRGKPPKGIKTDWLMHEYRLADPPKRERAYINHMRLDDWVLCRVYKKEYKNLKGSTKDEDNEAPDQQPPENAILPVGEEYELQPPVTGPGLQCPPKPGPGHGHGHGLQHPLLPGPGLQHPPKPGPGFHHPSMPGPGFQQAPLPGPRLQHPPFSGPGLQLPPLTGPGLQHPPITGPGFQSLIPDNMTNARLYNYNGNPGACSSTSNSFHSGFANHQNFQNHFARLAQQRGPVIQQEAVDVPLQQVCNDNQSSVYDNESPSQEARLYTLQSLSDYKEYIHEDYVHG